MACLNMFNNEQHQGLYNAMSPRISFSNDFADLREQPNIKLENIYREAPVSSEFAFSAPNDTMISADEIFSKGKMIPFQENRGKAAATTLREELLAGGDDDDGDVDVQPRLAKGTSRWKERLGLKRSHVASRRSDKNCDGSNLVSIDEMKVQEIV